MRAGNGPATPQTCGRGSRLAVVLASVFALTACSAPAPTTSPASATSSAAAGFVMPAAVDISGYSDVHAVLDPAKESMVFPIDAFFVDEASRGLIAQANALLWDDCMREGGRTYPPAAFDLASQPSEPDTRYGSWGMERASRSGYTFSSSDGPEMDAAVAALQATASDAGWDPAFEECLASVERLPAPSQGSGGESDLALAGPAMTVTEDALMLAMTNALWDETRAAWSDCLATQGLTLRSGEESPWGPEVPEDPEAAIRTAVVDVQCKEETGLVETLSSLEAQYQAALIDENRAALDEVAQKEKEIVERAEKILAEHGR